MQPVDSTPGPSTVAFTQAATDLTSRLLPLAVMQADASLRRNETLLLLEGAVFTVDLGVIAALLGALFTTTSSKLSDWLPLTPLAIALVISILLLGPGLFLKQSELPDAVATDVDTADDESKLNSSDQGAGDRAPAAQPVREGQPVAGIWIALVLIVPPAIVAAFYTYLGGPARIVAIAFVVAGMAAVGVLAGQDVRDRTLGAVVFGVDAAIGLGVVLFLNWLIRTISPVVRAGWTWAANKIGDGFTQVVDLFRSVDPRWWHGALISAAALAFLWLVLRMLGTRTAPSLDMGPTPTASLAALRGLDDPYLELLSHLNDARAANENIARGHAKRIRQSVTMVLFGLVGSIALRLWVSFGS